MIYYIAFGLSDLNPGFCVERGALLSYNSSRLKFSNMKFRVANKGARAAEPNSVFLLRS
jgi:hypothetical protein